jgi:predicted transcriptional regulator
VARTKSPAGGTTLREALQRLGARRVEATIVATLLEAGPMETKELVERTGLRQPEVSVGMRELRERGWIASEPIPRQGKGRPMHRHRLAAGKAEVRRHYEQRGEETLAAFEEALQVLRQRLA